jgi:hypothetical protein
MVGMIDPASVAALTSAFVNGLALFLSELRRRKDGVASSQEMRGALLQLEEYISLWADQAMHTDMGARAWASGLPGSAGHALGDIADSAAVQSMMVADVDSALGRKVGIIPPSFAGDTSDQPTLERILRVYAPEFFELLVIFSRRKQQLEAMTDELEHRYAVGGRAAVDDYLGEMNEAAEGLQQARRVLAEFISREFPLGASGKAR